jgi:hypothetical protein
LVLVGFLTSAVNVSQDGKLRRDFRKSAIAQLSPLSTIGIAQMEKELVKNFKSAEKRYANLETTQDYSEENVKQMNTKFWRNLSKRTLEEKDLKLIVV